MLNKEERCSSAGLLIFYGPVNVVELGKELKNSVILHCFYGRPSGWSDTIYHLAPARYFHMSYVQYLAVISSKFIISLRQSTNQINGYGFSTFL